MLTHVHSFRSYFDWEGWRSYLFLFSFSLLNSGLDAILNLQGSSGKECLGRQEGEDKRMNQSYLRLVKTWMRTILVHGIAGASATTTAMAFSIAKTMITIIWTLTWPCNWCLRWLVLRRAPPQPQQRQQRQQQAPSSSIYIIWGGLDAVGLVWTSPSAFTTARATVRASTATATNTAPTRIGCKCMLNAISQQERRARYCKSSHHVIKPSKRIST